VRNPSKGSRCLLEQEILPSLHSIVNTQGKDFTVSRTAGLKIKPITELE